MPQIRSLIIQLFKMVGLIIRKHASKTLDANISGVFFIDFFFLISIYFELLYESLYNILSIYLIYGYYYIGL